MFRIRNRSGLTLIELIVAFGILMTLSLMALPLARVKVQREKERLLRDRLDEMRTAIDRFKDAADSGKLGADLDPDNHGYPESLEILVEGVTVTAGMGMGMGAPGGMGMDTQRGRSGSGNRFDGFRQQGSAFGNQGGGFGQQGAFGQQSGGLGSQRGGSRGGFGSSSRSMSGDAMSDEEGESTIRFLRKIPVDPMTGFADWGMRSLNDDPGSYSWGGENVFDVFSKSMDQALDGTYYRDW